MKEPEKIVLTDKEWMDIIDKNRDGLPVCCANVSALRDVITDIAREGGEVSFFNRAELEKTIHWVKEGHELPPLIEKICHQLGLDKV